MISDKTRKVLWGRSGNRCAFCRQELVLARTDADPESVVGDECHIASAAEHGPRHAEGWSPEQFGDIENLLLLCRVHHKLIDDQPETYTSQLLQHMKVNHERWVAACLGEPQPLRLRRPSEGKAAYLVRLTSGRDLLNLVLGAYASALDNDDLESDEEVAAVGGFLQDLRDWGEIGDDLEPSQRVQAAFSLSKAVERLDEAGFWVFGGREVHRLEGGRSSPQNWPVAIVRVVRAKNPEIIRVGGQEESGPSGDDA